MSLIEQNEENYDLGVQPAEIYNQKHLLGKGYIGKSEPVTMAIILGVQGCDYEHGNIYEEVFRHFLLLTGSVDGKKNKLFMEGAGHRVSVNDNQKSINIEGE